MTKEELVKLGLNEDLATKVAAASAEEFKGYVTKDRFNEVNETNKSLKTQVTDRDKQLETLKKETGDAEALKAKITELQETNKTAKEAHEKQIKQLQLDHAVESVLTGAKAKNVKAVRALLDLDDVEIDDDGKVKGLDKQVKKLSEGDDTKFLFDISEDQQPNNDGKPKTNLYGMTPVSPDKGGAGAEQSIGASFAARYNSTIMPVQTGTANNGDTQQ
jgi:hypothetical protein